MNTTSLGRGEVRVESIAIYHLKCQDFKKKYEKYNVIGKFDQTTEKKALVEIIFEGILMFTLADISKQLL